MEAAVRTARASFRPGRRRVFAKATAIGDAGGLRRAERPALFVHEDGTPVTANWYRAKMRACFVDVLDDHGDPLPPELTIPHAIRAAGCTALVKAGAPEFIIKILGRWRFDSAISYTRYVPSAFLGLHKAGGMQDMPGYVPNNKNRWFYELVTGWAWLEPYVRKPMCENL